MVPPVASVASRAHSGAVSRLA